MNTPFRFPSSDWALILGASSGFGAATAIELANHGMNIFGVHFDRAATMPNVQKIISEIENAGSKAMFFNVNASDATRRNETLDAIAKTFVEDSGGKGNPSNNVKVLMHSLAFGTLKAYISENPAEMLTQAQIEMTMDVMANSIVYWSQGLITRKLMRKGGRIFGMTSSGGNSALPFYGAVSAAKAALESHVRQLAMEVGKYGITANTILAGVTDTPALRKIPGSTDMLAVSLAKNPSGRLTLPGDVAKAIAMLSLDNAQFMSGGKIHVDGGEDIVQFVGQKQVVPLK
ncbi:MAG: SDR family oxidoreductase [Ignavibacteriales bacterium]|nr:SDR family oxidoreductase [Ignavibacteriales bacterium]